MGDAETALKCPLDAFEAAALVSSGVFVVEA